MAKVVTENFKVETTNELYNSFLNENENAVQSFKESLEAYSAINNTGYKYYSYTVDSGLGTTYATTANIHNQVVVIHNNTVLSANSVPPQ